MMPEAGAVIDAARAVWALQDYPTSGDMMDAVVALGGALATLDAKLASAGGPPSKVEQDRTWGEVVAGDEILSAKTQRWYEIHTSVRTSDGKMKVMIKGSSKPIVRPVTDPVRVRRGVDGEAVDILEVLFSGQTAPTHAPVTKDAGPMLTDKVEDDE